MDGEEEIGDKDDDEKENEGEGEEKKMIEETSRRA